jgi:hypothetical protein
MNRNLLIIFWTFFCILGFVSTGSGAEQDDSLLVQAPQGQIDTLRLLSDKPVKSPWGAVLRSAILPGWGQLYNRKYIKSAVVFAVNGVLVWKILDYNKQWQDTKSENFRDRRNQYIWIFGLTYLLTMVDAYVDANLFGFDEAMEISWKPPEKEQSAWMLSLKIKFKP